MTSPDTDNEFTTIDLDNLKPPTVPKLEEPVEPLEVLIGDEALEQNSDEIQPLVGDEAEDEEKRKAFGLKAKERIGSLTEKNKKLQAELEEAKRAQEKLEKERKDFYRKNTEQRAKDAENTLKARLELAQSKRRKAREEGNEAEEEKAIEEISEVKAWQVQLNAWKAQNLSAAPSSDEEAATDTKNTESKKPEVREPEQKELSPSFKKWMRSNPWFDLKLLQDVQAGYRDVDPEDTKEVARYNMSVFAAQLSGRLLRQGYNPDDPDDPEFGQEAYIAEVNKGMRKAFPSYFKNTTAADSLPPVAPKPRPSQQGESNKGKKSVQFTKDEYDTARMIAGYSGGKVSVHDIAKEKAQPGSSFKPAYRK